MLKKVIANAKMHVEAGDPRRIYSQYIRYALDEFSDLRKLTSVEAVKSGKKDVILEHVIPHAFVMDKLLKLDSLTTEGIELILNKYFCLCLITEAEDKRLSAAGLRNKMPDEWCEIDGSIFARYEHDMVKILIHKEN